MTPAIPEFAPTEEQLLIREAARSTKDNLLISALAGAAKTSTLVLLAKALPTTPILCLAFNKKIAQEMKERLSSNCQAKTLNGLGHQVWMQTTGKRLTIESSKTYNILSSLINDLPDRDKNNIYPLIGETIKAIDAGKTAGYVPSSFTSTALMSEDDLFAWLDEAPTPLQEDLIIRASEMSVKQAFEGLIDFNDQILLPTVFPATFPQFPLVMVDEAQDLSALNHATLHKLARQRIFAVGDACQAIYGFRGAHENSMDLLRETFKMRELTLSISFRCPQNVVKEAQWRAPHMQWGPAAAEGVVRSLERWSAADIPLAAAIICRNNAPIFRLALKLIQSGRYPEIVGNDIGKALLKILKKLGDEKMKQEQVLEKIAQWKAAKLAKSRSPGSIADQAECLMLFAEQGETLGAAIAFAEHLINSAGPVKMLTIHKSKGLEFDHVLILDKDLIRTTEAQERNLLYVAITRAKQTLTYVYSGGFAG